MHTMNLCGCLYRHAPTPVFKNLYNTAASQAIPCCYATWKLTGMDGCMS